MKKHFTIDIGHSNPHIGTFLNQRLIEVRPYQDNPLSFDSEVSVSNVTNKKIKLGNKIHTYIEYFKNGFFFDMPVNYSQSIGQDRLFQSYYLYKTLTNRPLALIDAGTFITIDFITDKGLVGGYIYPGIELFLQTYQYGNNLPHLTKALWSKNPISSLGHSTHQAIANALTSYLESILQHTIDYHLHLTGGDGIFFNQLRPATLEPDLIHYSLYYLFEKKKERIQ